MLTRHYDQRPFDKTVCDAIIANDGVKEPSKKVKNVCDDGRIKYGSNFIHGAFRKMLANYDVNHRIASPYHPQSSGQVELIESLN